MSFAGNWAYRSFVNNPDLAVPFNNLRFGSGTLVLLEPEIGKISGTLGGAGWSLALDGIAQGEAPLTLRWQGRGQIGGEEWVYDYLGYSVPDWPSGEGQIDAIVGSIIRSEPHSNGGAAAGFVATFYAVRQF